MFTIYNVLAKTSCLLIVLMVCALLIMPRVEGVVFVRRIKQKSQVHQHILLRFSHLSMKGKGR